MVLVALLLAGTSFPATGTAASELPSEVPPDSGSSVPPQQAGQEQTSDVVTFAVLARDGHPPESRIPDSPSGLRVWSDGDSVSYFMTTNLLNMLQQQGAIPVRAADYKISSRLVDPSGYSAVLGVPFSWWFTYVPNEMVRYDPDLVVLMVGGNDAVFVDAASYGRKAAEMMDSFEEGGRLFVWVGMPSFGRSDLAARAPSLNAAAKAEAESRDWVIFVDTTHVSADGGDGVHFSPVRARLLAEAVVEAVFPGQLTATAAGGGE